jgi:predicted NUDIX family phosphoesterase
MPLIAFVPRAALPHALPHTGLLPDPDARHLHALRGALDWAERAPLELDPSKKQLIPYVVIRCGARCWAMRRTRAQSEARLHDKLSLGVGGHMERPDAGEDDPILAALRRELHEEVCLPHTPTLRFIGLINDDSTEVGQVHLGLLYEASLSEEIMAEVAVRETDKHIGQWMTDAQLERERARLETWSQIALDALSA